MMVNLAGIVYQNISIHFKILHEPLSCCESENKQTKVGTLKKNKSQNDKLKLMDKIYAKRKDSIP